MTGAPLRDVHDFKLANLKAQAGPSTPVKATSSFSILPLAGLARLANSATPFPSEMLIDYVRVYTN